MTVNFDANNQNHKLFYVDKQTSFHITMMVSSRRNQASVQTFAAVTSLNVAGDVSRVTLLTSRSGGILTGTVWVKRRETGRGERRRTQSSSIKLTLGAREPPEFYIST